MDYIVKLKYEIAGIKETILNYTPNLNVKNFLNELEKALDKNDMIGINYYLEQLCKWYDDNIEEIRSNQFVIDCDSHDRNSKILHEIYHNVKKQETFDKYLYSDKKKEKKDLSKAYNKIFLSHSSNDKKYGDALEKFITSLGIKNDQLIYTSHPLHKIPTNENIYSYLKSNINKNIYVIFLLSDNYLNSVACLNEMGAAWVTETDYVNIYVPNFDFKNPKYHQCAVDTEKMGIILKNDEICKMGIIDLKNKIVSAFGLEVDEKSVSFNIDNFMNEIS